MGSRRRVAKRTLKHPCEASRRRLRAKPKTEEALLPRCSSSRLPGTAPSPPLHPDRGSERPSRRPPISRTERPRSDPEAAGSPEVRNPSPASFTASAAPSLPLLRPIATERHPRKRRLRIARSPRRRTVAAPNFRRQQTRAARGRRHARARRIPPATRAPPTTRTPHAAATARLPPRAPSAIRTLTACRMPQPLAAPHRPHAPREPTRARRAPSARKPPSPAPSRTPRCKRSAPRGSCRCPACPRR